MVLRSIPSAKFKKKNFYFHISLDYTSKNIIKKFDIDISTSF